jgi:murein DD-endopeptidase
VQKEMPTSVRVLTYRIHSLSRSYRIWLLSLSLVTIAIIWWKPPSDYVLLRSKESLLESTLLPQDSEPLDQLLSEEAPLPPPADELDQKMEQATGAYEHCVTKGDTLEGILNQYGVELAEIARLSKQHPVLRHLHIGQRLQWHLDEQQQLQRLQWQLSQREVRYYHRVGSRFTEQREQLTGLWQQQKISGTIVNNFANSARESGLTQQEIQEITKVFQWQFNFRQLRPGDQFELLLSREFLEGKKAQSQLLAARFCLSKRTYYAIRGEDGCFYDQTGHGLAKGFLRLPTLTRYPISSAFNPKRRHPITNRLAPHNGVDFAMPSGTPVVTVGDGEVVQSGYSSTAGYYLVIRHGRQYITRYFHLQKFLVTLGQRVKRGEKIALSGNSGRSTGPHLHFEFHINQCPVNPLTARLPTAEELMGSERQLFLAKAQEILRYFP